jgi:histidyl-tRNA synthetase
VVLSFGNVRYVVEKLKVKLKNMREIKESTYKGTRILLGNKKRVILNEMIELLTNQQFQEISIPIIQFQETFKNKVGEENNNMMFNFKDRAERELCLAPEYTAVIQKLAQTTFKNQKDVKLFYVQECFRGEKPQSGRYRQFTQLGVEIINPSQDYQTYLSEIALTLCVISNTKREYFISYDVTRGLDYYKNGKGFEISCPTLGSSNQVCGGGEYDNGVGFAIGIDRLISPTK